MTVKTTLSFTDRHHSFLSQQVRDGVFASLSAGVAVALEAMIAEHAARQMALDTMRDDIIRRLATPDTDYAPLNAVFDDVLSKPYPK